MPAYTIVYPQYNADAGQIIQSLLARSMLEAYDAAGVLGYTQVHVLNGWPPAPPEGLEAFWQFAPPGPGVGTPGWWTRPARPGASWTWDNTELTWVDTRPLDERRDERWELIKAAETAADAAPYTWSGHVFQADALSRDRMREQVLDATLAGIAGQAWSIEWTLADNTQLTMSAAEITAVYRGLAARAAAAHETAQALREAIYTSTQPETIAWPTP